MDIFNVLIYKLANNDLNNLSNKELERHYNIYGKYENRICNIINFDINYYRNNNNDLKKFNDKNIINHFIKFGQYENRKCNAYNDLNPIIIKSNNNKNFNFLFTDKGGGAGDVGVDGGAGDVGAAGNSDVINYFIGNVSVYSNLKFNNFKNYTYCPNVNVISNNFDYIKKNKIIFTNYLKLEDNATYSFIINKKNILASFLPYYKETLDTITEMLYKVDVQDKVDVKDKVDVIILSVINCKSINNIVGSNKCEEYFYKCINNECTIIKIGDVGDVGDVRDVGDVELDYYIISSSGIKKIISDNTENLNIRYITRPCFKGNCKKCNYLWSIYYRVTSYWDNVFCINLGLDVEKRNNMIKYCNLLNANKDSFFYKGNLGINMPNIKVLKRLNIYNRRANESMKDGTIGLNITQQQLIKHCINKNYKHVLLLEDDISFNQKEYLHVLNDIFNKFDTIDILYLGCSNYEKNINSTMDLVDITCGNYNVYRPKKDILQKVCIGGFFAVLMSQKALQIYNERFTPINNISDVLLCDITYDIKHDYSDEIMTKTNYNLKSYYIIKNLVNADISKPSMTESNIGDVSILKNITKNKYINYLSKIKKLQFINNYENSIINIHISKSAQTYYNEIVNLIISKLKSIGKGKVNINRTYNSKCIISIYTIHDTKDVINNTKDITNNTKDVINNNCINICINGENKKCTKGTDIGIITNLQYTNPYNIYFPQINLSLWERRDVCIKPNSKKHFCAYMYSYDIPHRVNIFNYISTYKKVDAMGKSCFNMNDKVHNTRNIYDKDKTYNDIAVSLYSDYKFVLALENEDSNGYVTEKLLNPLLASSIPIYYGSVDAFKIINKKRVIYVNDYSNYADLLEYIKLVDSDDILYNNIIKEPLFIDTLKLIKDVKAIDIKAIDVEAIEVEAIEVEAIDVKAIEVNNINIITNIRKHFINILSINIDKALGIIPKNILVTKKYINNLNYDFIINGLDMNGLDISDFTHKDDIINGKDGKDGKSIDFVDKILWINLDKSIDRNKYMTNLFKNVAIPNIRINAINGNTDNVQDMMSGGVGGGVGGGGGGGGIIENRTMSKSEIGCTLSHIKAINYLKDVEGDYFLICEDDITLSNINLIPYSLKEIINNAPKFDILLIHKIYCRNLSNIYTDWNVEYNKDNNNFAICSTASYVISRSGINKICNEVCSYDSTANKFTFNKKISVADIFLYNYTNTWVYKYNFISTKDEDSVIHTSHIEYHKKSTKIQLDVISNDFGYGGFS